MNAGRSVAMLGASVLATACSTRPQNAQQQDAAAPPGQEVARRALEPQDAGAIFGDAAIAGVVRFEGTPPPARRLEGATLAECAPLMPEADRVVRDIEVVGGKLANVFAYVMTGLPRGASYPVPSDPVRIDNRGCRFAPRVAGIRVGQPLELGNSDPVLHNFHGHASGTSFNAAAGPLGSVYRTTLNGPQVMVLVVCDIHPWMHSYLGVLEHPFFATTDAAGSFRIDRLPAGRYRLELWHELLGSKSVDVSVGPGQVATTVLTYGDPDLPPPGTRPRIPPRYEPLGW